MTYQDYYRSLDEAKRAKVAIAGRMFSVMHEAMHWLSKSHGEGNLEAYGPKSRFFAMAKCYAGLWHGFSEMCDNQSPRWQLETLWDEHVDYGFVALPENASTFRAAHEYLIANAYAPQPGGQA